ncbi:hypothetical protein SUDANB178_05112 [Streptomyces sp. enrichment culture]
MRAAVLHEIGREKPDILVDNAGILRDRVVFSMSEEEGDAVIRVHLLRRARRVLTPHFAGRPAGETFAAAEVLSLERG